MYELVVLQEKVNKQKFCKVTILNPHYLVTRIKTPPLSRWAFPGLLMDGECKKATRKPENLPHKFYDNESWNSHVLPTDDAKIYKLFDKIL